MWLLKFFYLGFKKGLFLFVYVVIDFYIDYFFFFFNEDEFLNIDEDFFFKCRISKIFFDMNEYICLFCKRFLKKNEFLLLVVCNNL